MKRKRTYKPNIPTYSITYKGYNFTLRYEPDFYMGGWAWTLECISADLDSDPELERVTDEITDNCDRWDEHGFDWLFDRNES